MITAEMILENRLFQGSYAELRKLLADKNGKWHDLGAAKQLVIPWNGSIIWWPDTGEILYQSTGREMFDRNPGEALEGSISKRRYSAWTGISKGKSKGLTLPQWFFQDPLSFLTCYHAQYFKGDVQAEADELYAKASRIIVPQLASKEFVVVHRAEPNSHYLGFTLEPANRPLQRYRGYETVDTIINVEIAHIMSYGTSAKDLASCSAAFARSVMNAVDGDKPQIWDKARCETFFNDAENFFAAASDVIEAEVKSYKESAKAA